MLWFESSAGYLFMKPTIEGPPEDACPKCGESEIDAMTPRTVYACGSSDYDQRPGTFEQGAGCKPSEKLTHEAGDQKL